MVRKSRVEKKIEEADNDQVFIHVLYDEHETGGEPESDEPYCNRSDKNTTVHFRGALVVGTKGVNLYEMGYSSFSNAFPAPKAAFEPPRTTVYAVVAYYSDGDTFGHSYGNLFIVDVYGNMDKAQAVAEQIRHDDRVEKGKKNPSIFGESTRYVPWGGYFARLERVEVEVLHVLRTSMNPADTKQEPPKNPNDIPSW